MLLLLTNFGKEGTPAPMIAKISQETLAEIETTRVGKKRDSNFTPRILEGKSASSSIGERSNK